MANFETRVDDERCETVQNYDGATRDTLILAREAAHRVSVDGLRHMEIIQDGNDQRIEVRARR